MCDPDTEGEKKKGGGVIHLGLNAEKLQNTWVKGVLFLSPTTSIAAKVRPALTPRWAEQHRAWAQSAEWWHVCLCLAHFPPSTLPPLPTNLCRSFHSF